METDPINITVTDGKEYAITIEYGDAVMNGNSSFFDFSDQLHQGQISNVLLGNGKAIRGNTLEVASTLPLDNAAAQFVSVIYKIDGQSIVRRTKIISGVKLYILQTDINFV